MTSELKPCPFCGGEAELEEMGKNEWEISCTSSLEDCYINPVVSTDDKELSIKVWNTRAVPPSTHRSLSHE